MARAARVALDEDEHVETEVNRRFDSPRAFALALSLFFLVAIVLTTIIVPVAHSVEEVLDTLLWYVTALSLCTFALGPQTRFTGVRNMLLLKLLVLTASVILFLCPLLPIHRRGIGKVSGAAQAAAAVFVVTRAWQLVHAIEAARRGGSDLSWGFGRRLYKMCAWSWHDLERTRVISGASHNVGTSSAARRAHQP